MSRQIIAVISAVALSFGSISPVFAQWGGSGGAVAAASVAPVAGASMGSELVQVRDDRGYRGNRSYRHGNRYQGPRRHYGQRYHGHRRYYGHRYYRDRGYGGAVALGIVGLAAGAAIASQAGPGGDDYCASRFRSYDPRSGTYLGYDGLRHPCP